MQVFLKRRSLFQLTKFNLDNNSKLLHATALQNYSRLFVHLDDIADIDVHLDDIDDITFSERNDLVVLGSSVYRCMVVVRSC